MIVSKHAAACSSICQSDTLYNLSFDGCPTRKYQSIYCRKDYKVKKVSSKSWCTPITLLHTAVCLDGMAVTSHSFMKCTLALAYRLSHYFFFHLNATKYRLHDKITGELTAAGERDRLTLSLCYFQGCVQVNVLGKPTSSTYLFHSFCVYSNVELLSNMVIFYVTETWQHHACWYSIWYLTVEPNHIFGKTKQNQNQKEVRCLWKIRRGRIAWKNVKLL